MRVIAGSLKGRRLKAPTWPDLRPTSDKLRETLFNVLASRIRGARVLDVYAGTGAVGIEALSRGARSVTFIEADRRAERLIVANLATCGLKNGYAIIRSDATRALEQLAEHSPLEPFDVVLLDPPYAPARRASLTALLATAGRLVAATGVVALEHSRRQTTPAATGPLVRTRSVGSGDSVLTFYERQREVEEGTR